MEKTQVLHKSRVETRQLATMGMMVALAYVVTVLTRFPLMSAAPFLKYDPKDVVILIGAYLFGPLAGLAMSAVTCFIEMITVSDAGLYGFIMNLVASAAFVCPAAFVYRRRRTMGGAILGLALGVAAMAATMVLWNYIITPLYFGMPRASVVDMMPMITASAHEIVHGDAEEIAQGDDLLRFGVRLARLPLADGLTGNAERFGKPLLRNFVSLS